MIAAVDVDYRDPGAVAACVLFETFASTHAHAEKVTRIAKVEDYQPGEFYKRELPCLLAVLEGITGLQAIIVDGYAWLADGKPGLGARLNQILRVPVIGVAKTEFHGAPSIEVFRGTSAKPLYVTAAGMDPYVAAHAVTSMHGNDRMPVLLRRVDRLARDVRPD